MRRRLAGAALLAVLPVVAACSGDGDDPVVVPPSTTTSTVLEGPAGNATGGKPLTRNGDDYTIRWGALRAKPRYVLPDGDSDDPFFYIHTDPEADGFLFALEMYTTFGGGWSGDTGTYAISCSSGGTGICVRFDPDGDGPEPDFGADHGITGTIEIRRLDENGYDLTITKIVIPKVPERLVAPIVLAGGAPENPGGGVSD